MVAVDLRQIARALGGEVHGSYALVPGPGHSRRDRSLSVRLSDSSADGYIVHSHAGDDWRLCREHIADAIGLPRDRWRDQREVDPAEVERRRQARQQAEARDHAKTVRLQRRAIGIWNEAVDPCGSAVERYLKNERALELPPEVAGDVLRFHPRCPFGDTTVPAMVAAIRSIASGEIIGIHRTGLTVEGQKIGRKVFGSAMGGAIMLDRLGSGLVELTAGEGVETSMAARQLGLRPVWSLISTSNIAVLPPIPGVQRLTLLAENDTDPKRPSERACGQAGERWRAASRTVDLLWPPQGCKDLNDALMEAAR